MHIIMKIPLSPLPSTRSLTLTTITLAVLLTGCTTPQALSTSELTEAGRQRMAQLEKRMAGLSDGVSLAEAMTWAMDNNLSLRAETLERAIATGNRKLATAAMLPNLSAQAGYRWRNNPSASRSESVATGATSLVASTSQDTEGTSASLEASWNVLDFGLAWLRARQEGEREHLATESRRRMAHQLALDVVSAWDRALAFQRIEAPLRQTRSEVTAALRQLEVIAASRLRDPVDVLEYRSSLLLILKRMDSLVLQMDQSRDDLARLLGLPAGTPLNLEAGGDLVVGTLPKADLRAWQYVALLNRPEVRQSLYARRSADRNAYKRIIEQFPSLLFKYGTNYDSNSFMVNNAWDDASVSLSLGLMRLATLPLQYKQAAVERQQAEVQADLQATAVLSQVAIASKAAVFTTRASCLSEALAQTSDERMGLLDARARAAALDELSLIRARVDNMLVRIERDMALMDARRANLMLAQSVGVGGLPEQLTAESGDARVSEVAAWLQSGLAAGLRSQLAMVEKEFGVKAAESADDVLSGKDNAAGDQSLCL